MADFQAIVDDRRVRYFCTAVDEGSIRAAADMLDMNPSVISRQISQLESDLGVALLERHGRGVKPTLAGHLLLDYGRQRMKALDDLKGKLDEIHSLDRGHIEMVVGEAYVNDVITSSFQRFWKRYPNLTMAITVAGTNDLIRQVDHDTAWIGIVFNPPATGRFRSRAAICQPMCAIVPPRHPLAMMRRAPTLADLAPYPTGQLKESFGIRQLVAQAEHMERVRLNHVLTCNSMSVLKEFVLAGLGITLLPAFVVASEIREGKLVAIPIDQPALAGAKTHIITRVGRQLPKAANELLMQLVAILSEVYESDGPAIGLRSP